MRPAFKDMLAKQELEGAMNVHSRRQGLQSDKQLTHACRGVAWGGSLCGSQQLCGGAGQQVKCQVPRAVLPAKPL